MTPRPFSGIPAPYRTGGSGTGSAPPASSAAVARLRRVVLWLVFGAGPGLVLAAAVLAAPALQVQWQIRRLRAGDAGERSDAIRALAAPDARTALHRLTRDPDSSVRRLAIQTLGRIADPESRPWIRARLRDATPEVRVVAALALRFDFGESSDEIRDALRTYAGSSPGTPAHPLQFLARRVLNEDADALAGAPVSWRAWWERARALPVEVAR